jgi:transcriptional regulator with XRE-family HTH domain
MTAIPMRNLKAKMMLKDLSLKDVSRRSGVPYTMASAILNGRMVHPEYARRIQRAIEGAPAPKGALA